MDATRAIDMFRKMDVPVIGLVENMAGYHCPHCGEASDPFGSGGGAEAAARTMSIPFLGRIPLRTSIREASDAGTPPAARGARRRRFSGNWRSSCSSNSAPAPVDPRSRRFSRPKVSPEHI